MTTGDASQRHLFCFGLGYSATRLAQKLLQEGWRVSGTHRTLEQCEAQRQHGITAHLFDEDLPLSGVWDMQTITHILISIPPSADGDIVLKHHLDDLQQLPNLEWVGYFSTTGVYGNYDGAWVDETSPLLASTPRTLLRVQAEQAWINSTLPVHIFRLAGIYGPKRNTIEQLKKGMAKRIDLPNQYFSRIHVEDICQIVQASIAHPNPPAIYNCCDDRPCPQAEVVTYAATLLGIEPPAFVNLEDANLSEMAHSFYGQNRRTKNHKIKQELGVSLRYPSYKEGLRDILL